MRSRRQREENTEFKSTGTDKGFKKERRIVSRCNDVSWYSKDPQLIKDSASIPFAEPLGPVVEYGPNSRSIPGIAALYYVPTVGPVGTSAPGQAPINLAAVHYYSEIRKANAGARNYDPNDLIQILLGMAGVYEAIAFCKRLYSLLREYQMTNRYYSKRLVESMNVDFDNLLQHIADLRYFINVSITRASVFAIPRDMSFLLRRVWMCESIFLDAPMRKAQTYLYCPLLVQHYDWSVGEVNLQLWTNDAGDIATTNPDDKTQDSKITFDHIVHTISNLIGDMAVNTDVGIITGDLIKAYGEGGLFKLAQIEVDYHIEPTFNQEVLTQIHNADFILSSLNLDGFTGAGWLSSFTIVQSGALLGYNSTYNNPFVSDCRIMSQHSVPKYQSTGAGNVREDLHLLDMPLDPVSAEMVMVATRLMVTRSMASVDTTTGTAAYELTDFGSEVLVGAKLYSLVSSYTYSTWLTNDQGITIADLLKYVMPFSYLPRGYVFVKQVDYPLSGESAWAFNEIEVSTIDNYTVIADSTLRKQHQTAILSEFSIPVIGAGSKQ